MKVNTPRIATWSIVNNEIDFIADIVDYHLEWVDSMYILDTGSTDGTLEYLLDKSRNLPEKLIIEEYSTKYTPEYDVPWEDMKNPFPEVDVRNYAIKRCKELCEPNWIIQLDGDEIFLDTTKELIAIHQNAVSLNHSTINPVCDTKTHRKEFRFGHYFYDPHSRVWNTKYAIEYMKNSSVGSQQFHCNPTIKGWNRHLFETPGTVWVKNNFHIHLHWMYGRKMESFFKKNSGLISKQDLVSRTPINEFGKLLPARFLDKRKKWELNTDAE